MNVVERRARARRLVEEEKVPVRIALRALFLSRSMYYYKPGDSEDGRRRRLDEELAEKMRAKRFAFLAQGGYDVYSAPFLSIRSMTG